MGVRGRDRRDGLPRISDGRVWRNFERRIQEHRFAKQVLDHQRALDAGKLLRGGGIDREHPGVGHARVHKLRIQHARRLDVRRVARLPAHLRRTVPARGRCADELQVRIDGQHRRLCDLDRALLVMQRIAGNAHGHRHRVLAGCARLSGCRRNSVVQ